VSAGKVVRKNAPLVPWIRAVVFFAAAFAAVSAVPFYPQASRPLIAAACAALGLFAPALGVLAFVLVLAPPLAAGDFLVGILFLIVGLAAVQYLGQQGARAFVVVALAFLASILRAEWALAPLAGYVLGASDGAVAAFLAVAIVEAAGVVLGHTSAGVLATGGAKPMVDIAVLRALHAPLSFGWLAGAVGKLDVDRVVKILGGVRDAPLLILQPLLFGVAAALSGSLVKRESPMRSVAVVTATTAALGVATMAITTALHGPVPISLMIPPAIVSLVVAAAVASVAAWVFPLVSVPDAVGLPSLRAEDADVDELLRMIANAEEALADRHSTDATVMITDMKSFSRMTQEQGTVATAKMIQRHRDLLLPIVLRAGGHGKSAGGDGLVAAFTSPDEALGAAVEIQRALKKYNAKKPPEQQIEVRVGLASGDVIVDRGGCPFIGDALNLAARVMNLADGGQVFAAGDVVDGASDLPSPVVSHGAFTLKNITLPVDVYEVLWDEGQQPRRPELEPSAA
jgi:class 3 adenylate cyclase